MIMMHSTMKRQIALLISIIGCVLLVNINTSIASPIIGSNENYEYLLGGSDLSKFSIGAYARERNLKVRPTPTYGMVDYKMKMEKVMGFVGYDIVRWGTLYGIFSSTDTRLDSGENIPFRHEMFNGEETEYGAGFLINLIDHDIADPTLIEDRIRITAGIEYTSCSTYWNLASAEVRWKELYASMRISLINQVQGWKEYWPHAIAIYGGPAYCSIDSSSLDSGGDAGFIAGVEIYYSERISFDFGCEQLDAMGYNVGFTLKF